MANTIHAVVRTDSMLGTDTVSALVNGKFYSNSNPAEIDNGNIVILSEKIDREVYKVTAPTSTSKPTDLYLVACEELFYDESKPHYLNEWVNEAGSVLRLYKLVSGNTFAVTKEAFDGTPDKGKFVALADSSTKIKVQDSDADASTFGKIVFTETVGFGSGAYKYFVVDVL